MIPIVSIVGKSDSGKTTLIEKIVPELVRRGYRVTTVKHDLHGFEIDKEGKDSWRHKQAGAQGVIISSPQKVALIRDVDKDMSLEELRDSFGGDADLILSEGYKKDVQPKAILYRQLSCSGFSTPGTVERTHRFKCESRDISEIPLKYLP